MRERTYETDCAVGKEICQERYNFLVSMVPPARLERALPCGKRILSPLRLPIPPRGLGALKRYALGRGDTPDIERRRAPAKLELR